MDDQRFVERLDAMAGRVAVDDRLTDIHVGLMPPVVPTSLAARRRLARPMAVAGLAAAATVAGAVMLVGRHDRGEQQASSAPPDPIAAPAPAPVPVEERRFPIVDTDSLPFDPGPLHAQIFEEGGDGFVRTGLYAIGSPDDLGEVLTVTAFMPGSPDPALEGGPTRRADVVEQDQGGGTSALIWDRETTTFVMVGRDLEVMYAMVDSIRPSATLGFTTSALPAGVTEVAPPAPAGAEPRVVLMSDWEDPAPGLTVETENEPARQLTAGKVVDPVDVAGRRGWVETDVAQNVRRLFVELAPRWTIAFVTRASVSTEDLVGIAAGVRFVDRATFADHYAIGPLPGGQPITADDGAAVPVSMIDEPVSAEVPGVAIGDPRPAGVYFPVIDGEAIGLRGTPSLVTAAAGDGTAARIVVGRDPLLDRPSLISIVSSASHDPFPGPEEPGPRRPDVIEWAMGDQWTGLKFDRDGVLVTMVGSTEDLDLMYDLVDLVERRAGDNADAVEFTAPLPAGLQIIAETTFVSPEPYPSVIYPELSIDVRSGPAVAHLLFASEVRPVVVAGRDGWSGVAAEGHPVLAIDLGDDLSLVITALEPRSDLESVAARIRLTDERTWSDYFGSPVDAANPSPDAGGVNASPVAGDDVLVAFPGDPIAVDVLGNDFDPDGDPLRITDVTTEQDAAVSLTDSGRLVFEPLSDAADEYVLTYTIADTSGETDTATVRVIITPR